MLADTMADSMGLNAAVPTSAPSSDLETIDARLHTLGIRHIRAGIYNNDPSYDAAMTGYLEASGAKLDGITDCPGIAYYPTSPTNATDIQGFDAAIGGRLESVEGPDEVDLRNDSKWVSDTLACLPNLRSAEPSLPFYGPSIADQVHDATLLGNISSSVDYGNAHRYFSGRNPGTGGWGGQFPCGIYGALTWSICETRINGGSKPIVITETGYNSQSEIDEATQAKYLSRLFLVNLQAGISRTFVFDLLDYTNSDGFQGDGLLHTDFSPKPSFYAIANELAAFSDPGQKVSQLPLHYSISGAGKTIEHQLFKRRDGTFMLAIWNETASWDITKHAEIVVAPQRITITAGTLPYAITAESLNDSGAFVKANVPTSGNQMGIIVDDHLTLLSFREN